MAQGDIIVNKGDEADKAFMLSIGKIVYQPSEDATFVFQGKNMIIGASELVLEKEDNEVKKRHMTIKEGDFCTIKSIPKKTLLNRLESYNIGFNVAKSIASNLVNLHTVVNKKNEKLSKHEKIARDLCKTFATTVFKLENAIDKHEASFLENLVKDMKDTVTFNYGLTLIDQSAQAKFETDNASLNKFKRNYPPGSVIVQEGDEAEEMYILSEGTIGVYIHDKQIDTIKEKGQIIGEMGFILNQPRTATLKADDSVYLIVVDKPRIKSFFEQNPSVFIQMVTTLARREEYLTNLISEIDQLIHDAAPALEMEQQQLENYKSDLVALKEKLDNIILQRRTAWIVDIFEKYNEDIKKLGLLD